MSKLIAPVTWVLTFFVILFIYTRFFGSLPLSINMVATQKNVTFDVSGEGSVFVVPDTAKVNVGVSSQALTVKQAQNQLNSAINQVSQAIKNLSVDPKDIKTEAYSINPDYDFSGSSRKIIGYSAQANLVILARDIDKINAIIDVATQNGANQIGGLSFEVSDKEKAENKAREKAVAEAKKKAENAAKIAGFRLGRIVNYTESFNSMPRPLLLVGGGVLDKATPTQVEPGSSEISLVVTLSYEIQ
ncbi:hypothetical protein A3D02_00420 [Candidatus Daviesbacteria bacterium RIFCSPHIGHO2_02_FULL_39_41]|nr:MAG: hypothetical protein A3D02_00420 [Candidatus Daviesbacteria bacterium RIFCSPHIGHO2_02_FULL_39_41]OGE45348.1 MAG: hypothetical protein A3E67_01985 [Candidatus Daviesbacteria bacterium RIFCSPHIGHO2_12_FULL_38_25]